MDSSYCGISLKWSYPEQSVNMTVPIYVTKHQLSTPQDCPYTNTSSMCCQTIEACSNRWLSVRVKRCGVRTIHPANSQQLPILLWKNWQTNHSQCHAWTGSQKPPQKQQWSKQNNSSTPCPPSSILHPNEVICYWTLDMVLHASWSNASYLATTTRPTSEQDDISSLTVSLKLGTLSIIWLYFWPCMGWEQSWCSVWVIVVVVYYQCPKLLVIVGWALNRRSEWADLYACSWFNTMQVEFWLISTTSAIVPFVLNVSKNQFVFLLSCLMEYVAI